VLTGPWKVELADLGVECDQQPHLGGDDGGVGRLHRRRLAQLGGVEVLLQPFCFGVDVTAAGSPQHGGDLRPGKVRSPIRIRGQGERLQRVGLVQVWEGLQGGGELPQRAAPPQ
jgi:hypothetical protein